MSTLELKAGDVVTGATRSNVKSHDFTIIWSYAIFAVAVFAAIYAITITPDSDPVDFALLSMSP